ncbi:MAG TPA: BatD family protein [Cytophaga sp.]|nr:BatD family protein [Cytophaga sp.]
MHSSYITNAQTCFAEVELDRRSVYVQQPFKVTITVLTETWYTAPLEFDNIQIPNAFILPFERTVPGMFTINDKQYAGLQFYYIVFPYKAGTFTVPSINIVATTPAEGSSVSRKINLHSKAQTFTVKKIPQKFEGTSWLVAKNVFIQEHWNKPLHNLKTGDVIERTVTINAKGTLPQFIPELKEKDLDFANVYPQDAELEDTRDDYEANGRLTQSFIYLLEKDGDYTLPAMTMEWWNPVTQRLYKRSLPAYKLHVAANTNLGMVATLKDSLDAVNVQTPSITAAKKGPLMIAGMIWYLFAARMIAAIIALYMLIRIATYGYKYMRTSRAVYKESELYWFRHLMASSISNNEFWKRLYQWWDRSFVVNKKASIHETFLNANEQALQDNINEANKIIYKSAGNDKINTSVLKSAFKTYRNTNKNKDVTKDTSISESQQEWPIK